MNTTYAQGKHCKEFRLIDNKYQPCGQPVEDSIRAWGQVIEPVRCKEHRARNFYNSRSERDKRACIEIQNHDCKKSNCNIVCTFGQW